MAGRLTGKQRRELEIIKFFVPPNVSHWADNMEDGTISVAAFFALSDRGIQPSYGQTQRKRYKALVAGKTFREVHVEMWKQDLKEGIVYAFELVADLPEHIGGFAMNALGMNYDKIKQAWCQPQSDHQTAWPRPSRSKKAKSKVLADYLANKRDINNAYEAF